MAVKLDLLGQSGGCGLQGFDAGAPAHLAKGEAYGAATTPKSAPDMAFLPSVRRLTAVPRFQPKISGFRLSEVSSFL